MFKDNTERYETRIDIQRNLLDISIELVLRFLKYVQKIILDSPFTTDEKNDLNTMVYDLVRNIKNTMQQSTKLELIISDLTINKENIAYIS